MGVINERHKEIKRRRHRRKVYAQMAKQAETANASEKAEMARKLRLMTPGAEELIARWGLEER